MNYLLIGNEFYNLRKRKEELVKQADVSDLNLLIYDNCTGTDLDEMISDCQTIPFFADKKVVILQNPAFIIDNKSADKNDLDHIINYLKQPSDTTDLIVYVEKTGAVSQSAIKQLTKYIKIEKYDTLDDTQFKDLVIKDLNENHIKIDKRGLELLLKRLPNNVENWKSELEKLIIYGEPLDRNAIDNLITRQLEKDSFSLTNAINNNDLDQALRVFRDLLTVDKNSLHGLLALIATQFRTMSQYKMLQEMGLSNQQIATKMNVKPGSVYYKLEACNGRSSKQLLEILNNLAQLDQNIKSGKIDPVIGSELFIVKTIRG